MPFSLKFRREMGQNRPNGPAGCRAALAATGLAIAGLYDASHRREGRAHSAGRSGHLGAARARLRARRRAGVAAGVSPHRYGGNVRQRTRGRRGAAGLGRPARGRLRHHQDVALAFRAARAGAGRQGQPGAAAAVRRRSVAAALAQPANSAGRDAGRLVPRQAARARAPHRRVQLHGPADRGGGAARRASRWSATRSRCIRFSTSRK